MPAWTVAILVALVGLLGALIGTVARIVHERGAELRTRMLDAADDFVTAASRAQEIIELAALPTSVWVEIASMEMSEGMRKDRQEKVEVAHANAQSAWDASRPRLPRIVLLFGVDSSAAAAAKRADDALGEALVGLSEAYVGTHREEPLEPERELLDGDAVLDRAAERLEVAGDALREFSAAARNAIAGRWWRLGSKPFLLPKRP